MAWREPRQQYQLPHPQQHPQQRQQHQYPQNQQLPSNYNHHVHNDNEFDDSRMNPNPSSFASPSRGEPPERSMTQYTTLELERSETQYTRKGGDVDRSVTQYTTGGVDRSVTQYTTGGVDRSVTQYTTGGLDRSVTQYTTAGTERSESQYSPASSRGIGQPRIRDNDPQHRWADKQDQQYVDKGDSYQQSEQLQQYSHQYDQSSYPTSPQQQSMQSHQNRYHTNVHNPQQEQDQPFTQHYLEKGQNHLLSPIQGYQQREPSHPGSHSNHHPPPQNKLDRNYAGGIVGKDGGFLPSAPKGQRNPHQEQNQQYMQQFPQKGQYNLQSHSQGYPQQDSSHPGSHSYRQIPSQNHAERNPPGGIVGKDGVFIPSAPRGSSHPLTLFNQPPKSVIKAVQDYVAKMANELSFQRGDFFYVMAESSEFYYEVVNPLAKTRGNVPKTHFESLEQLTQRSLANAVIGPNGLDGPAAVRTRNQMQDRGNSDKSPLNGGSYPQYKQPPALAQVSAPVLASPIGVSRGSGGDRIMSAIILSSKKRDDGRQYFAVEITRCAYTTQQWFKSVIYRNHDDFWALQVSLLNFFPMESGRGGVGGSVPRRIPFMPSPVGKDLTPDLVRKIRAKLDIYLRTLFVEIRVENIVESGVLRKWFTPRLGDIEFFDEDVHDIGDGALDSLLDEYGGESIIVVRIISGGKEILVLRVPDNIRLRDLVCQIENNLKRRILGLSYKDEIDSMVLLCGDEDLGLLMSTSWDVGLNLFLK